MKVTILSIFLLAFSASIGLPHGVERGEKYLRILDPEIQNRIFGMVERSCDLRRVVSIEISDVKVKFEKPDQNIRDYFYTVTLAAIGSEDSENQSITVNAAKYDINNPQIDRYEVMSVKSTICD